MALDRGQRTQFSTLSDDEFLRQIGDTNKKSPIIAELVTRLERAKGFHFNEEKPHEMECPVCQAELVLKLNFEKQTFNLFPSE